MDTGQLVLQYCVSCHNKPHCLWTTAYYINNLVFDHSTTHTALFVESALISVIFVV